MTTVQATEAGEGLAISSVRLRGWEADVVTPAMFLLLDQERVYVYSPCCQASLYEGPAPGDEDPTVAGLYEAVCITCDEPTGLRLLDQDRWPWDEAQGALGLLLGLDPLATVIETAGLFGHLEDLREGLT